MIIVLDDPDPASVFSSIIDADMLVKVFEDEKTYSPSISSASQNTLFTLTSGVGYWAKMMDDTR